jgi:hypothetical protein
MYHHSGPWSQVIQAAEAEVRAQAEAEAGQADAERRRKEALKKALIQATTAGKLPDFPSSTTPAIILNIMKRCVAVQSSNRPSFGDIVTMLEQGDRIHGPVPVTGKQAAGKGMIVVGDPPNGFPFCGCIESKTLLNLV